MNNKGFTLIEILAVVALIALVMSIASRGVSTAIEKSKRKSEALFVSRVNFVIDDYLDYMTLNKSDFIVDTSVATMTFQKCYGYKGSKCRSDDLKNVNINLIKKKDGNNITLKDLVDAGLIDADTFMNPNTKEKCRYLDSTVIYLFKDSDYVYYYYTDLGDACNITKKDNINIINTLPEQFCDSDTNKGIVAGINSKICDNNG